MHSNESEFLALPQEMDFPAKQERLKKQPRTQIRTKPSAQERLRDPILFVQELCKYFRSSMEQLWKNKEPRGIIADNWHKNVVSNFENLQRNILVFNEELTLQNVNRFLRGQSAEFLLANGIRDMIDKLNMKDVAHVPEWNAKELIYLGDKYFFQSLTPANAYLLAAEERRFQSHGEIDSLVLVKEDILYMLDATVSQKRMEQKALQEQLPGNEFLHFRTAMKDLLETSRGKRGYNVTKIHALFSSHVEEGQSTIVRQDGESAIVGLRFPAYHAVSEMAELCRSNLEKMGAIVWKKNRATCELHEEAILPKKS